MKPRIILEELKKDKTRKISIILGARQVGKTTILKELYSKYCNKKNCLFLDLDIFSNFEKINTYEKLITTLKLNGYKEDQKEMFYLFLDEFQRYEDISIIMKNVYDNTTNIKIFATGSSIINIKNSIQESLAGRKRVTHVYPLNFQEFLWFKDIRTDLRNTKGLAGKELQGPTKELYDLLSEFIVFGGYPEVVLQNSHKEKIKALDSIFDMYIKRDLIDYINLGKVINIKRLIEYIAVNNGQKIKYEEITKVSSLNFKQIREYIEVLVETNLITVIRPFFKNKNKEIVKIPKIYFCDNGVRNFFINNFNSLKLRQDSGYLFEGYVISEIIKSGTKKDSIKFWQDKNKREVDIIIDSHSNQTPIEVKFKKEIKREDLTGLSAFLEEYPKVKTSYIINTGTQEKKDNINLRLPYLFNYLT